MYVVNAHERFVVTANNQSARYAAYLAYQAAKQAILKGS